MWDRLEVGGIWWKKIDRLRTTDTLFEAVQDLESRVPPSASQVHRRLAADRHLVGIEGLRSLAKRCFEFLVSPILEWVAELRAVLIHSKRGSVTNTGDRNLLAVVGRHPH